MKKVLVTGGAGMIGSNLVKRLVTLKNDVHIVDNLSRGKIEYLNGADGHSVIDLKTRFHKADLCLPGVIEDLGIKFDTVYHLADVVAGIGFVFSNQLSIFRTNLLINSNVVDSMRIIKPSAYIYVGTACSFPANLQDGTYEKPLVETDQYPANPESAYGWSKLMGEYEAFLLEKEHGVPVSVLSLHNVYGAPCDFGLEKSQVIPALIRRAICFPVESFTVWGSGNQGRAFVHVDDVVDALVATADRGLNKGLIQIGPSHCTSIGDLSRIIVGISGKPINIKFDTTKPEGDHSRFADYSKAQQLLNWSPRIGIRDGLSELYRWIENRI
jgi:GDP-D-mannose 3',5'-epimerase